MRIVISYLYADDECIVMRVVKTSGVFLRESDDGVVHSRHLWYGTHQLDVLNQPEISFSELFGRPSGRHAPYNHSYIPYGWPRTLILPSGSLLLRWVRLLLIDEPLQLSLSDKGFNLLLQVVTISHVTAVVIVEWAILISRPLIRVSLQLVGKG